MAVLFVRRVSPRRWPAALAIAATAFALVLGPWVLRNERVLGAPLLRSNLGLELAIDFHPGAVDPADRGKAAMDRARQIHPFSSQRALEALRSAGGEVPYSRRLGEETKRWILAHPGAAMRIATRHVVQFLFPPAWFFRGSDPAADRAIAAKAPLAWLMTAVGLLGLVRRLAEKPRSGFIYVAGVVGVTILFYAIAQPIIRCRYLIHVPLAFFAADFGFWVLTRFPGIGEAIDTIDRRLSRAKDRDGTARVA